MTSDDSTYITDNEGIGYCPFVVDTKPYCLWDWDPNTLNLEFLRSIDPWYYAHIANTYGPLLDSDNPHYAATALCTAYSQSLETLFALLCATAQAPNCVVGWMHRYSNHDLYEVTKKINSRLRIPNCNHNSPVTWESLSAEINCYIAKDKMPDVQNAFARLWSRLASDFIDEYSAKEYNSIKHGLRVTMGGTTVAIGLERSHGVPASPEHMRIVGSSKFGTTFLVKDDLGDKNNFRLKSHSRNWNPSKFTSALVLVSISISNILSALSINFGVDATNTEFKYPSDISAFDAPWNWDSEIGLTLSGMNSIIKAEHIRRFTAAEILELYKKEFEGA